MKIKRELLIILVIQITEVLGFSLILPYLPFYAESLGASPIVIAAILSVFSLFQLFSAPILGRISDSYGRRPILLISQLSTFISFIILAYSNSIEHIFLSRAVDGLFGSNMAVAQAYIGDITTKKDRSKAYGISGMAFGLGFLVGPAIGGYLSKISYSIPAFLAAGVSLVTILATYFLLPETVRNQTKESTKFKAIDLGIFRKYLIESKSSSYLFQFFSFVLTHVIWSSNFAIYAGRKLNFDAQDVGIMLAYVGLINVSLRGLLMPKLIDRFSEAKLMLSGMTSVIIGLMVLSTASGYFFLLPAITFFAYGSGITRPLLMGNISRSVSEREQGAVMGVANSLASMAQIFGPLFGGYLLTKFIPESLMYVSMLVMGMGLALFLKNQTELKKRVQK